MSDTQQTTIEAGQREVEGKKTTQPKISNKAEMTDEKLENHEKTRQQRKISADLKKYLKYRKTAAQNEVE